MLDINIEWPDNLDIDTVSTKLSELIGAITAGMITTDILSVLNNNSKSGNQDKLEIAKLTMQKLLKFYDKIDPDTENNMIQNPNEPVVRPTNVFKKDMDNEID